MIALVLLLAAAPAGGVVDSPLERFECARCHDVPGARAVDDDHHCTRCHQRIAAGTYPASAADLARWQREIKHLRELPSLAGLSGRVRRRWVEQMLLHPHDERPGLAETMPRLPVGPDDARAIAIALVAEPPDERPVLWPKDATPARGRAVFSRHCATCHRLGALDARATGAPALAPDLAGVGAKMTPRSLAAWIANPRALLPTASMPAPGLDDLDRLAVTRFLVEGAGPAGSAARALPPPRLPPLSRRVGWDEVNQRVFLRSCWHCHSDPDLAGGDGGPGNTGGFGYAGRGLSFASYSETLAGSLDDGGARRSLFAPVPDGPFAGAPRLVAHLLARQREETGAQDAVLGMPLGLPALGAEDVQLIESWIVQGTPR